MFQPTPVNFPPGMFGGPQAPIPQMQMPNLSMPSFQMPQMNFGAPLTPQNPLPPIVPPMPGGMPGGLAALLQQGQGQSGIQAQLAQLAAQTAQLPQQAPPVQALAPAAKEKTFAGTIKAKGEERDAKQAKTQMGKWRKRQETNNR